MALPPPSDPNHPDHAAWLAAHAGAPAPAEPTVDQPEADAVPVKKAARPRKAAAKKAAK